MSVSNPLPRESAMKTVVTTSILSSPFLLHGVLAAPSQWLHFAAVWALLNVAYTADAWSRASAKSARVP